MQTSRTSRQSNTCANTVIVYGREGCPKCADAKQWFQGQRIPSSFRKIFTQPLSRDERQALSRKTPAGAYDLYAPKGARRVGLPEERRVFTPDQSTGHQGGNLLFTSDSKFDSGPAGPASGSPCPPTQSAPNTRQRLFHAPHRSPLQSLRHPPRPHLPRRSKAERASLLPQLVGAEEDEIVSHRSGQS